MQILKRRELFYLEWAICETLLTLIGEKEASAELDQAWGRPSWQ
jgi:hypothetical protein